MGVAEYDTKMQRKHNIYGTTSTSPQLHVFGL